MMLLVFPFSLVAVALTVAAAWFALMVIESWVDALWQSFFLLLLLLLPLLVMLVLAMHECGNASRSLHSLGKSSRESLSSRSALQEEQCCC